MQDPQTIDTILSQSQVLDGKKVDCKRAVPRDQGHTQTYPEAPYFKTKKMFVGGLPPDVTNDTFKSFFEQFGDVEDSVVILDKDTGRPRGFGFITFVSDETADRVLENYEKNCINGKWVECKKATPKQAQSGFQGYQAPYMMYQPFHQNYQYDYYGREYMSNYPPQVFANSAEFNYPYAYPQNTVDMPNNENPK